MPRAKIGKVLVTGGLGFIGSWTVDKLIERDYEVIALDNLTYQVHRGIMPKYANSKAKHIKGDIRDRELIKEIIKDVEGIIHLAALVGVGQSMYKIADYVDVNVKGTAVLLDVLVNEENHVRKLVVASSMSIYGEGKYYCEKCQAYIFPDLRSEEQLRKKIWEQLCPQCGNTLNPVPTDENKPPKPTSIYAQTKYYQEQMSLLIGKTYGIPTIALRYFNVYGPRQSLANPYTGVCAIFLSRILNNKPPVIFEDGEQTRDFIYVEDVAEANVVALEAGANAYYEVFNVGTGKPTSIKRIAQELVKAVKAGVKVDIIGKARKGDIRHCYADITKAEKMLSWKPKTSLEQGLSVLAKWAIENRWGAVDLFEKAYKELIDKGLLI